MLVSKLASIVALLVLIMTGAPAFASSSSPCLEDSPSAFPYAFQSSSFVVIAHSATLATYVCGVHYANSDTSGTSSVKIRYGVTTTTPCDTSYVNLDNSGPLTAPVVMGFAGATVFYIPAGFDVCIIAIGTPVISGNLSYVQQ